MQLTQANRNLVTAQSNAAGQQSDPLEGMDEEYSLLDGHGVALPLETVTVTAVVTGIKQGEPHAVPMEWPGQEAWDEVSRLKAAIRWMLTDMGDFGCAMAVKSIVRNEAEHLMNPHAIALLEVLEEKV